MPNERNSFNADDPIPLAHSEPLSEPEKLLATYFSSSSVGLSFLDSQLRYLAINNTLAEIHGVPAPDHLGKTVRDILGDFADLIEPQLQRVFSTGEPILNLDVTAMFAARTGSGHWVANHFPIKDHSGRVTRVGLVVVEVSAQKELRQSVKDLSGKLRKEMGRLQMLLDISSIMASTSDIHQVFPKVSARIRRVLRHEYAGFELHDAGTGLLIRQAEDFPLGKGLLSAVQISPHNSPGGLALHERAPLIFSKQQMQGFEAEITKNLLAEGLRQNLRTQARATHPEQQYRPEIRALHVSAQFGKRHQVLLLPFDNVDPAHPLLFAVASPQGRILLPEAVHFIVGLPVGGGSVHGAAKVRGNCESKAHITLDSASLTRLQS